MNLLQLFRSPVLLVFTLCMISNPLLSQATPANPVDPNAAVRYLMALGWFIAPGEKVYSDLSDLETSADWPRIATETRQYLEKSEHAMVMKLMNQGAACSQCNFVPDRTFSPDDFIPPLRRLREMTRVARGLGIKRLVEGDHKSALEAFSSIYRLGQHLEEDGYLIGAMVGVSFRKQALNCIQDLMAHPIPSDTIELAKEFLRSVPKPALKLKPLIISEKKFITKSLALARQNPTLLAELDIFPASPTVNEAQTTASPGKACAASQRILNGAWEMVMMDYEIIPATLTADVNKFLVTQGYLKAFPICPEAGEYQLFQNPDATWSWRCSKHPGPDAIADESSSNSAKRDPKLIEKLTGFVASPEFDRLQTEAEAYYDEVLAIDETQPDALEKLDVFQKKVDSSTNVIVRVSIPNFKKVLEKGKDLEKQISEMLK